MAHTLIKHSHSAPTDCLLCVLAPLCTKRKKYFVSFLFNQWGESVWPGRVMWDLFAVALNFKWQIKVKLHARFEPGWAWTDASSAEGDTVLPWRRCQSSLSVTKVFEEKKSVKRGVVLMIMLYFCQQNIYFTSNFSKSFTPNTVSIHKHKMKSEELQSRADTNTKTCSLPAFSWRHLNRQEQEVRSSLL